MKYRDAHHDARRAVKSHATPSTISSHPRVHVPGRLVEPQRMLAPLLGDFGTTKGLHVEVGQQSRGDDHGW